MTKTQKPIEHGTRISQWFLEYDGAGAALDPVNFITIGTGYANYPGSPTDKAHCAKIEEWIASLPAGHTASEYWDDENYIEQVMECDGDPLS